MKQLIVMIATVILGSAIGTIVMGFGGEASEMKESVDSKLGNVIGEFEAAGE